MQLTKLAALLPALVLVCASPLGVRDEMPTPAGVPGGNLAESDRDGTFKLTIEGARAEKGAKTIEGADIKWRYRGEVGDHVLGHYTGHSDIVEAYLIPRLKPTGSDRIRMKQTIGAMFALANQPATAIIQCSVTSTGTIPVNSEVIFDLKDPAKPMAWATAGGPFEHVKCESVNVGLGS